MSYKRVYFTQITLQDFTGAFANFMRAQAPNEVVGATYYYIYLVLLHYSLEGDGRLDNDIDYLSSITRFSVKAIEETLALTERRGKVIKQNDGKLFFPEALEKTRSITSDALRKAGQRQRKSGQIPAKCGKSASRVNSNSNKKELKKKASSPSTAKRGSMSGNILLASKDNKKKEEAISDDELASILSRIEEHKQSNESSKEGKI